MKLYLISQSRNNEYDTYDSAVVAAKSPSDAREIHPSISLPQASVSKWGDAGGGYQCGVYEWVAYDERDCIKVKYLGETKEERGVILASFNAG